VPVVARTSHRGHASVRIWTVPGVFDDACLLLAEYVRAFQIFAHPEGWYLAHARNSIVQQFVEGTRVRAARWCRPSSCRLASTSGLLRNPTSSRHLLGVISESRLRLRPVLHRNGISIDPSVQIVRSKDFQLSQLPLFWARIWSAAGRRGFRELRARCSAAEPTRRSRIGADKQHRLLTDESAGRGACHKVHCRA
jgi:hypothetical protein